ncbi:MAG: carboxylesterase, partial [Cellvibrio sp.]
TYPKPLGGVLALSTYLATQNSIVEHPANKSIPILVQHGSEDSVVDEVLGQRAYRQLSDRGYLVKYESYPMEHTLCLKQIESIREWVLDRF